jgi:hypothetical protein
LLAWDHFLTLLKRTYPDKKFYQEDLFARVLGSFVHGGSSTSQERRTGELLANQAKNQIFGVSEGLPTLLKEEKELTDLLDRLGRRAHTPQAQGQGGLFLADVGVMPAYKKKRMVVGLSLLFKSIEDPMLRAQLEQIGFRVLLQFAPEFGLIALGGAIGGAASADAEDGPQFLTDAIDRGLGFEISFPSIQPPEQGLSAQLELKSPANGLSQYPLLVLSPTQEILSAELKARMNQEWSKKAVKVGLQYLAILIPAVKAYQAADRDQSFLRKLAILAGYFVAKKAIDHANEPDLRSWSLLPRFWVGEHLSVPPGNYSGTLRLTGRGGTRNYDLGPIVFREGGDQVVYRKVLEINGTSSVQNEGHPAAPSVP